MEGEDLVEAAGSVEPVDLLVAGENVEPALLAEVSTLAHAPRVIGVYRRDDLPRGVRPVTLALWHVGDPGNVGTLLRSADAFGAGVALSSGCADPTGPKALRASMGAVFRVPISSFDEPRGRRVALVPAGGTPLPELELDGDIVFVLGAERDGPAGRGARALRRHRVHPAGGRRGVAERRDGRDGRALRARAALTRTKKIQRAGCAFVHFVQPAFRLGVAPSS